MDFNIKHDDLEKLAEAKTLKKRWCVHVFGKIMESTEYLTDFR